MTQNIRHVKLLIIGSGPAGYTAAIYGARALLKPVLISGFEPGGQLMITTDVENYPGFAAPVQGPDLMEQMRAQAEHVGAELISDYVVSVDLKTKPFVVACDSGTVFSCDAVIIATGAKAKWLGLASEEKFRGFGVSACATCDGFFYRGKEVLVVGGGNTALEEALYLSHIVKKATIIHRRDSFRAEAILQKRVANASNIVCLYDCVVEDILGRQDPYAVEKARIKNIKTGEIQDVAVDGVFVAIGHKPASDLFEGQLPLKTGGYLETVPGRTATTVPGVFAAGDVADDFYRQAVTAAGMGCMAALEAEKYLASFI